MPHRIVVALGGNALQTSNKNGSEVQKQVAKHTAKQLAQLIADGHQIIVTHGNGPQVGAILLNEETGAGGAASQLDTCSAMSQGEIGYWLQQALYNELQKQGINKPVATIVTQTLVDFHDPAFKDPSKPIGPFYPDKAAAQAAAKAKSFTIKEDAGRGWRRVVPSPKPIGFLEASLIAQAIDQGSVVIAAGGGGVPVIKRRNQLIGIEAVIDKDFAAAKLAELVNADTLLILTSVDQVTINFKQPNEQPLGKITVDQMQSYIDQGQFAPGSMRPKVQAAINFVKSGPGRTTIITTPQQAFSAIKGGQGTTIKA